jgi:serine/threonine-protein kinase
VGPPADPAERFGQLWQQGQRPDVDAFLAQAGPLSPDQLAVVLRVDQRARWQAGERILVESYLQRHPLLREHAEPLRDLLYHEFLLRQRHGEQPSLEEYRQRYPEHMSVLQAQLELDRAIDGELQATGEHPRADWLPAAKASPDATSDWAPGPATVDLARAPAAVPTGPLVLVKPAVLLLQQEVQTLLRQRLRWLTLLMTLVSIATVALLPKVRNALWTDPVKFAVQGSLLNQSLVVAVLVATGLAAVLWSRRRLSLRALRLIEWALVGALIGYMVLDIHSILVDAFHAPLPPQVQWMRVPMIAARGPLWALSLVCYGLFIPNSWRRCVAVVSILAPVPLVVVAAFSLNHPGDAVWSRHLVEAESFIALFAALGAVLAIYGTHKLTTLREVQHATRQLGQYRLLRRLGAGSMGEVYLAEHRLLKRPCAVKLIRPEKAGDAAMLQRFEREVQAMTRLTHWNVVEVFDYGRADDGTFYYVMEYLPGLTLEELVQRHGPLPPGRAVHLLRQVCAALREAHAKGLTHRDLKPGNVIVGERGGVYDVAKLLDFGLVQGPDLVDAAEKLTQYGALVGTPAYLSPEQARGGGEVGPASDLYSLGALGYYLLTGQPPFVRPSVVQTITAHITDPAVPLSQLRPEIPTDLERVILTCLEKDRDRRFADAGAVEQALAGCACARAWSPTDAGAWWQARMAEPTAAELQR